MKSLSFLVSLELLRKIKICTFSRGGSDITGSIIAAGVKADLYENFTDVDGIFAAHPGIIHQPHSIPELTYREMRELAYAGFSVLHDEALLPAYRGKSLSLSRIPTTLTIQVLVSF